MRRIVTILLAFVLIFTFVSCEKQEIAEAEKLQEVESDLMVILNSTTRTTEDKWDELAEGKELILVSVTIKNNSEDEYEFNPNYVQMNVDGHIEMKTDKNPKDEDSMRSKIMLSGEEYTGVIPFEVEVGQEYRGIIYDDFNIQIELE